MEKDIQLKTLKEKETEIIKKHDDSGFYELPPNLQRLVHLYITGKYTAKKIGELMGFSTSWIYKQLSRPEVKHVIAEMQQANHEMVNLQMRALTLKAVDKLNHLIDSPIDGVALQAVKDVLDRTGHKTKNEIKIDKTVTTIEQKFKKLADVTISDDDYVEAEFEEVD